MTLALSLGNTNLRYLRVAGGEVVARGAVAITGGAIDPAELPLAPAGEETLVSSVHPRLLETVEAELFRRGLHARVAGRDLVVPIPNRYDDPSQAGVDRLLAVLAATRLFPGEGVAVFDLGTALTLSIGSPAGEFLGGAIALGLGAAASSLAERAPRLPSIAPVPPLSTAADFPPRDTRRAVNDGLVWQAVGCVERLLEEARRRLPWPVRALATGGDVELVAPLVRGLDRVEPDLVLRGLLACAGAAPPARAGEAS